MRASAARIVPQDQRLISARPLSGADWNAMTRRQDARILGKCKCTAHDAIKVAARRVVGHSRPGLTFDALFEQK